MKQFAWVRALAGRARRLINSLKWYRRRAWSIERVFKDAYDGMRTLESASGSGSTLTSTDKVRAALPGLIKELNVRRLLDAPCGDFNWMRYIELPDVQYFGVDLVPELIEGNQRLYGAANRSFSRGDIRHLDLPKVDLIVCRDCLVHLSFNDVALVLNNFARTGSTHLLTTHFPRVNKNQDISTGDWRPINLTIAPFHFPPPRWTLQERLVDEAEGTLKTLSLWRLRDLPLKNSDLC